MEHDFAIACNHLSEAPQPEIPMSEVDLVTNRAQVLEFSTTEVIGNPNLRAALDEPIYQMTTDKGRTTSNQYAFASPETHPLTSISVHCLMHMILPLPILKMVGCAITESNMLGQLSMKQ
jgi:hypothetical protein